MARHALAHILLRAIDLRIGSAPHRYMLVNRREIFLFQFRGFLEPCLGRRTHFLLGPESGITPFVLLIPTGSNSR